MHPPPEVLLSVLAGIEPMGVISGTSETLAVDSEESKWSIVFVWFKKRGLFGCGRVVGML
jgi:hypothetical protein